MGKGKKETNKIVVKMRSDLRDPELLGLLLQRLLAVVELLCHLWTRLLGHNVLQFNIQFVLLLYRETKQKNVEGTKSQSNLTLVTPCYKTLRAELHRTPVFLPL